MKGFVGVVSAKTFLVVAALLAFGTVSLASDAPRDALESVMPVPTSNDLEAGERDRAQEQEAARRLQDAANNLARGLEENERARQQAQESLRRDREATRIQVERTAFTYKAVVAGSIVAVIAIVAYWLATRKRDRRNAELAQDRKTEEQQRAAESMQRLFDDTQ